MTQSASANMRFSSMQQIRLYNTMRKARFYQKQYLDETETITESPRVSAESQKSATDDITIDSASSTISDTE